MPDFVDEDWSIITTQEDKVKSMQVLMSQPGLLFGVRDPWLKSKMGANSQQPSVSMLICAFRPVFAAVGYKPLNDFNMSFIDPELNEETAN